MLELYACITFAVWAELRTRMAEACAQGCFTCQGFPVTRMQVSTLPPDMAGKQTTRSWMSKLHGMPASYELTESEVRQLLFDLETAYNEFMSGIRLAPAR